MTVHDRAAPAMRWARRRRRGRSAASPPIAPRKGKRGESPGGAVGAVADRAGSAWPTPENEALYDGRGQRARLHPRPPLCIAKTAKRLKTLKTARAGYWRELAWIWDRRHVRSCSLVSKPRFAQRLAADHCCSIVFRLASIDRSRI